MSTDHCPHCDATIPALETAAQFCPTCGKQLPRAGMVDAVRAVLGDCLRRVAETFDRDDFADLLGKDASIAQAIIAAQRMADDCHGREVFLVDQLREIVDVGLGRIRS